MIFRKHRKYISVPQYSVTNVMYLLFNLLNINGLYMFRALLAHSIFLLVPPDSLQSWCSQLKLHARNITSAVCVAPFEDEQVMLETCRGP
jgi:hypothetical protein